MANDSNVSPEKQFVLDYIERNAEAIAQLGDAIFSFGEPGMQEFETAALMTGILEDGGFEVERGISGFPTGFVATFGSGQPVIAIHCEYDGNPGNSQQAGATEQSEIVPGAPGHCEGHNVNAAVMVGAALAVKGAMEEHGIGGTLKIFGAPAEELVLARPYYVRDGYFDDVDAAFHAHIWGEFSTEYGVLQTSVISAEFVFHGETAHAAMYPWRGRDALDAVVLMDTGMAQFREHMQPGTNCQRVITDGGEQPNVIPARAAVWWYFRAPDATGVRELFDHAEKIAEGAALMTKTEMEIEIKAAVWPVRANRAMAEIVQHNIDLVGMPEWSDEEHALARALQKACGREEEGLKREVTPLAGPSEQIPAANDCGDVSWKVPMARLWFPANVPNVAFHHWSAGSALATSIAHKGAVAGAQVLAAAVADMFADPKLVEHAKETFSQEIGDVVYEPLLPLDQRPDTGINRELMATYRPLMEKHYAKHKPTFA